MDGVLAQNIHPLNNELVFSPVTVHHSQSITRLTQMGSTCQQLRSIVSHIDSCLRYDIPLMIHCERKKLSGRFGMVNRCPIELPRVISVTGVVLQDGFCWFCMHLLKHDRHVLPYR